MAYDDVLDILNPRVWTGVVEQLPPPRDFIGDRFLPARGVAGDRLEWDIVQSEMQIAPITTRGVEAPVIDPEYIKAAWAEVTHIRFKDVLREQDVSMVRALGQGPPGVPVLTAMAEAARLRIARSSRRVLDSVRARIEWLRIKAMLGSIAITASEQSPLVWTITYPVVTVTASPLWSDLDDSDIILDLTTWFANRRFKPRYMVVPSTVLLNMAKNVKLRAYYGNLVGTPTILTVAQMQTVLANHFNLEIITYDAVYDTRTDSGTAITLSDNRFLPENKVIFLPDNDIGYTAEAPNVMNGYKPGIYPWTVDPVRDNRPDPPVYHIGWGWSGLPILEMPETIIVATVG